MPGPDPIPLPEPEPVPIEAGGPPPSGPDPGRFFVVWSPQGGPPMVRFPTFGAARSVAIRLSKKLPGQDFFVLQSCWGKPGVSAADETGPEVAAPGAT